MAEGKLILEVYEYAENTYESPHFEYIPCDLSSCMKHNNKATLREIVEHSFNTMPKKNQDSEKLREVLAGLKDADFAKITVVYHPKGSGLDASIELTNVMPVSLAYADARRLKNTNEAIILYGCYRLTDGKETTALKDAQRLTLVYNSHAEQHSVYGEEVAYDGNVKEICLNITFLQ